MQRPHKTFPAQQIVIVDCPINDRKIPVVSSRARDTGKDGGFPKTTSNSGPAASEKWELIFDPLIPVFVGD